MTWQSGDNRTILPVESATTSIILSDGRSAEGGVVVVGAFAAASGGQPTLAPGAERVDAALSGKLLGAYVLAGGTGAVDEVVRIPTLGLADPELVVVVGLGEAVRRPSAETLRRAAGAAARVLGRRARLHVAFGDGQHPQAVAEGVLLGGYRFTRYKSSASRSTDSHITITAPRTGRRAAQRAIEHGRVVAQAVNTTRDLVNIPPNDLYPETFADAAVELARSAGIDADVLDEAELAEGGYGGILAVGRGSVRPPRLVRLAYRPAGAGGRLALVGKGITFDSGGLNLKTANQTWMKSDMAGAAAVVAAMRAIADLGIGLEVIATIPMAENLPSGSAYRPSDILTLRDGTTVEIADTDAEGRLVLADAISRALEDKPSHLLEVSTLTGAQLVALGQRTIAAMGATDFRDRVVAIAAEVGEPAWAMPLTPELRAALDSPVADLVNTPAERWASMLIGGRFLADFIPAGLPWVHLDIAGPSWNTGAAWGYTPKGGTGVATRTIIATAEALAASAAVAGGGSSSGRKR
ncbi:MAG: leucyl aminopeptidase [Actinobacteria bacterium]|nr:leucyl aminopeptidase [Actinomycetota bacterium]